MASSARRRGELLEGWRALPVGRRVALAWGTQVDGSEELRAVVGRLRWTSSRDGWREQLVTYAMVVALIVGLAVIDGTTEDVVVGLAQASILVAATALHRVWWNETTGRRTADADVDLTRPRRPYDRSG